MNNWIICRVKSFSQSLIESRYQKTKVLLQDMVTEFYCPIITQVTNQNHKGQKTKTRIEKNMIPWVLFVKINNLDAVWQWKKYDPNIYGFYYSKKLGLSIISEQEIEDLRKSLKESAIDSNEIKIGDRVLVQRGPMMGISGTVDYLKKVGEVELVGIKAISAGLKFVSLLEVPKDYLVKIDEDKNVEI